MSCEPVSDLLTPAEIRLLEDLGQVWDDLSGVIGDGETRNEDLRVAAHHVHGLQNMVLAQAAARAYPTQFRLLGGYLETSDDG